MNEHYVIVRYDTDAMLLNLEAASLKDAKQLIAWQRQGGFTQPMHICTFDAQRRDFVCIDTAIPFCPSRPPYTAEAWDAFWARLEHPQGLSA